MAMHIGYGLIIVAAAVELLYESLSYFGYAYKIANSGIL